MNEPRFAKQINASSIWPVILLVLLSFAVGSSCADEYAHIGSVEQSGSMICIIKERYSAELKVRKPLTKGELYLFGGVFQAKDISGFTVRKCSSVSDKMMSIVTDNAVYLWINIEGVYQLKRPAGGPGNLSNDLKWIVSADKRTDLITGEEIPFKAKLPSDFLGNSPDWKTVITEGQNLVDKDRISLYVVDVETGAAKERFILRSNYMWMLNHAHQIAGLISDNLWISNQFGWAPDASGRFQLVYPVLEPGEKP